MGAYDQTSSYRCIYVFAIDDEAHKGVLKIGDAEVLKSDLPVDLLSPNSEALNESARKRINEYTGTAGISYRLLHTELAVRVANDPETGKGVLEAFRDHDVHTVLKNSGIGPKRINGTTGIEWYPVDLETARDAIAAVKGYRGNLAGTSAHVRTPIVFRPEQKEAITRTIRHFKKHDRMLWNAKMRFGKTLTALEVVKEMGFKRTIIMTHRPVVDEGWYGDFNKIFGPEDGYCYSSKGTDGVYGISHLIESDGNFVYFASIQDLRGSSAVGGKLKKNRTVFETDWDLVIVDEAHEGTQTALGDETVKAVVKEGQGDTKVLMLSGTPFNLMDSFDPKAVYTWDYVMEQRAKSDWDASHFGDSNPYEDLPSLKVLTYDLGEALADPALKSSEDLAFNFSEFFRVEEGTGRFAHEGAVRSFLNLLVKDDANSHYPFSRPEYRDLFRHSLWMVPGVAEARALERLMAEHPVFGCGEFDVVNVAGDLEGQGNALDAVKTAIAAADEGDRHTITISCGRLTTGVTVPEWTAVLMLSGSHSTSPSSYLQTIFRVQSPCKKGGKIKDVGYVFDFAPDRTLKMIATAVSESSRAHGTTKNDKAALGEFLNFCPIISMAGSAMTPYDASRLLQQLKRAQVDRVVNKGFEDASLYNNEELLRLAPEDLESIDRLKAKLKPGAGMGDSSEGVAVNEQGFTDEQYERVKQIERKKKADRTPEELEELKRAREARERRRSVISVLTAISIRMPLLIYGADVPYGEDIDLDGFVDMVDARSWDEFMPEGVSKADFKKVQRFYDEDVFIAAGRRIRDIAHHADTLPPAQRVDRIARLFACFRNPDKETVLTPWNVVNLQLAGTLGGWDFFDGRHEADDGVFPARFVNRGEVTRRVFFDHDSLCLDINSKTGLYPLYLAYSLYRARNGDVLETMGPDTQREAWDRVLSRSVFALCRTPMARAITIRTLAGYTGARVNVGYIPNLAGKIADDEGVRKIAKKLSSGRFWNREGSVEFTAVVGNPPYQQADGGHGTSSKPMYQRFVRTAFAMRPAYVSMITPSRWFSGGKGLDEFRAQMLADNHLRTLTDFPLLYEPFKQVKIRGGISFFLWDRDYRGPCTVQTVEHGIPVGKPVARDLNAYDVLVRRNEAVSILDKVLARDEKKLSERISARKPFGLPTNYKGGQAGPLFCKDPVELYANQRRVWVSRDDIPQNAGWIDKWKVLMTAVQGTSGAVETKFLSKPIVVGPGTACTETYIVAGVFDDRETAENYASYLRTRFLRFLVSLRKAGQHATSKVYGFVPDLPLDHPWTDELLYERYGLDEEEIAFIESIVAPQEQPLPEEGR